jgi:glutamate synthase (NADPH/NADH) small chain
MTAHASPRPVSDLPASARCDGGFDDLIPPMTALQAMTESDRCLYCWEAACVAACPTAIDIPGFIRRIGAGLPVAAGRTILASNVMGGTCARVCPTEELCEAACVRNTAEDRPVAIGRLQRHATDALFAAGVQPFTRAEDTGRTVAVIGAGPAGLACAHALSRKGHAVTVYEARPKAGGLNEYGLAAYKMAGGFAQQELDFILSLGGIEVVTDTALGRDIHLSDLTERFDAVFLGVGLSATRPLGLPGEDLAGVRDAVDFIAELRQTADLSTLTMPARVVVLGGGNTAIDAAVQAARLQTAHLGAGSVTLAYRRGEGQMTATHWELDLARANGVQVRFWSAPVAFTGAFTGTGAVTGVTLETTRLVEGGALEGTGETETVPADLVLKAVGQTLRAEDLDSVDLHNGRVAVRDGYRTSHPKVFAGGDCIWNGPDLTVRAVEDGKRAAAAIHDAIHSVLSA